jgi:deoxyribodipyrimidine photo-lyase
MTYHWFRRDLRLEDNAPLYYALKSGRPVRCVFIFDENILSPLPADDARVAFIHRQILRLNEQLQPYGSGVETFYGKPVEIWERLLQERTIDAVYAGQDYEPYARQRDAAVDALLARRGARLMLFKEHLIFHQDEILSDAGKPYTVFTPYKKKWLSRINDFFLQSYPTEKYFAALDKFHPPPVPTLASMGFAAAAQSPWAFPPADVDDEKIRRYDQTRDFPAQEGTTRLGVHLRFGTVSVRRWARKARELNPVFLNELIWRDFNAQILYHFPHVVGGAFRKEYDAIPWLNRPEDIRRWQEGRTGYPMVDAGMRELNATGFMHNRLRMITASFLTKHLLVDWRIGEAYFAEKLLDFDLASNNAGWQWSAGTGCDAAPYFRIFNPDEQMRKFDPERQYVLRWAPEYATTHPPRIVDHALARKRALETYQSVLKT